MAWLRALACGKVHLENSNGRLEEPSKNMFCWDGCCRWGHAFLSHGDKWLFKQKISLHWLIPDQAQSNAAKQPDNNSKNCCHSQTLKYNRTYFSNCCIDNRYKSSLSAHSEPKLGNKDRLFLLEKSKKIKRLYIWKRCLDSSKSCKMCPTH